MASPRTKKKSTSFRMCSSSSVRYTIHLLATRAYAYMLQFTTTCHVLRRRISGPHTRIVRQTALLTISAIRRWARPLSRLRAAFSRRMLSHATCFPRLILCSIHSSSVKRFRSSDISGLHPQVDGYDFSSSSTRADFPALCFHSRRLSSTRKFLSFLVFVNWC